MLRSSFLMTYIFSPFSYTLICWCTYDRFFSRRQQSSVIFERCSKMFGNIRRPDQTRDNCWPDEPLGSGIRIIQKPGPQNLIQYNDNTYTVQCKLTCTCILSLHLEKNSDTCLSGNWGTTSLSTTTVFKGILKLPCLQKVIF